MKGAPFSFSCTRVCCGDLDGLMTAWWSFVMQAKTQDKAQGLPQKKMCSLRGKIELLHGVKQFAIHA